MPKDANVTNGLTHMVLMWLAVASNGTVTRSMAKWLSPSGCRIRQRSPRRKSPFMRTARHGAKASVHMASSPTVAGVSGEFRNARGPKRISLRWVSPEGERRVWEHCARACEPWPKDLRSPIALP